MKNVFNGKERGAEEWSALVAQVDSRLQMRQVITPPGSLLSIIEIVMG